MNGPNDKENEPVERLIEKFDQLLENGDESIPPSEIENLSDEEIVELNRRLNCLQLLDAAREEKKLPPRKNLPPKRDFNDESTWSL